MAALPQAVRRLRGGTSAVDLDTEAGRAFYQERIGDFNRVFFLVSSGFFLFGVVLAPFYAPFYAGGTAPWTQPLTHAATLLVNVSAWLLCARRPGLPLRLLEWLDAGSLVVPLVGFSFQAAFAPPTFSSEIIESLVLILTNAAITRAVLVPDAAAHTALVSLLAALPVVVTLAAAPATPGLPPTLDAVERVWSVLWLMCAVVVAAVVSHVIYGLREEVRKARRLGQYTLEEKLGEGGMGTVYRARHALLRRPTAIKLLPPDKAGTVALSRFEREVQLTAALSHPNTVSVFDYGRTPDGVFYYVMEYLEGTNLDGLVSEDGPQPAARVAHILQQVAAALVEAHGIGLIHRDVKPENIILCERGGMPDVAKVVDFGLARDLERGDQARLTQANVVQGTPLYLSPEAITEPDRVAATSDIYSLGAVGYYLLTGRHVFSGATLVEVCSHHLHTRPTPPSERLGRPVPAGLEKVLLACLEKDPSRRPASAAALRDALLALSDLGSWSEEEARAWWSRWRERRAGRASSTTTGPESRTVSVALGTRTPRGHD
jgi:hypothetical protein